MGAAALPSPAVSAGAGAVAGGTAVALHASLHANKQLELLRDGLEWVGWRVRLRLRGRGRRRVWLPGGCRGRGLGGPGGRLPGGARPGGLLPCGGGLLSPGPSCGGGGLLGPRGVARAWGRRGAAWGRLGRAVEARPCGQRRWRELAG